MSAQLTFTTAGERDSLTPFRIQVGDLCFELHDAVKDSLGRR
jgi:hypothetical protein